MLRITQRTRVAHLRRESMPRKLVGVLISGALLQRKLKLALSLFLVCRLNLNCRIRERRARGPLAQAVETHELGELHGLVSDLTHALLALHRRQSAGHEVGGVSLLPHHSYIYLVAYHVIRHGRGLRDA